MRTMILFSLFLLSVASLFSQPVLPVSTETASPASAKEVWAPDTARDIIVDNDSLDFRLENSWIVSSSQSGYWGDNYMIHQRGLGISKAIWNPSIKTTGFYEIFITYTPHMNRATNATYAVYFDRGTSYKTIDQTELPTHWVSLGGYPFLANSRAKIVLTDLADGYVVADVLILTPRKNVESTPPVK